MAPAAAADIGWVSAGMAAKPACRAVIRSASGGAAVVYQTLNPAYSEWTAQFPALQAAVVSAAESTGARLVSMENVYMYGRPDGHTLTEDRPHNAHTKKGQLRSRMSEELLAAHRAGRVQVAIGRASDYFGPPRRRPIQLGRPRLPPSPGRQTGPGARRPFQPHTYTYVPDIGEGLAVLGEHPDAPGEVWHLPNDPETRTTRELVDMVFSLAGQPRSRLRRLPPLLLRGLGLFNPTTVNSSKCSTSSRNRSSWTAAKSRPGWESPQLRWLRPSPKPSKPIKPVVEAIETPGERELPL